MRKLLNSLSLVFGLVTSSALCPLAAEAFTVSITPWGDSGDGNYVVAWDNPPPTDSTWNWLLMATAYVYESKDGGPWEYIGWESDGGSVGFYGRPNGTYAYKVTLGWRYVIIGFAPLIAVIGESTNIATIRVLRRNPNVGYQIVNPHKNLGSYYKMQTHVHSHVEIVNTYTYSPELYGDSSIFSNWQPYDEIARLYARNLCFDVVSITDHSEYTKYECPAGITCFKGKESTVAGMHHWVVLDNEMTGSFLPTVEEARRSINIHSHPGEKVLAPHGKYAKAQVMYDGMEIKSPDQLMMLHWALDIGWYTRHAYWGFYADDYHPKSLGPELGRFHFGDYRVGWIVVNSQDSADRSILTNVKKGNFFAVKLLNANESVHPSTHYGPIPDDHPNNLFVEITVDTDRVIHVRAGGVSETIDFISRGQVNKDNVYTPRVLKRGNDTSEASYQVIGSEKYIQVVVRKWLRNRCSGLAEFVEIYSQALLVYGVESESKPPPAPTNLEIK